MITTEIRYFTELTGGEIANFSAELLSINPAIASLFNRAGQILEAGTPVGIIIWPEGKRVRPCTVDDVVEEPVKLKTPLKVSEIDLIQVWNSVESNG